MSNGQILDMGAIYRFYMSMTRLQLLKAPYKSRCQDYMEEWRKNGGKGPITQKMCKEKCKLDRSLELYGCVDARVDYPHNETICEKVIPRFHQEAMPVCAKKCGMPCKFDNYEFQVQQSFSEGFRNDCITAHDLACSTLVQIFLENMEISTFTYSPRLEPVGILSWIGGYVGLWLGISLIQVYDFLEARIFNGISYLQKRHARDKKRKHRRKLGFEGYQTKLYRKH
ncbi:degenerin mec-4-like [Parasteatoda tepidariorum]|uniref:degenerin mec-4-like n=1 Tax=Parasteatoda tepidariorum TaxID=114398 RepID=UPI0039BD63C5